MTQMRKAIRKNFHNPKRVLLKSALSMVSSKIIFKLKMQLTELQRENKELKRMSLTDELTGLHNYRYIQKQLHIEMQRALRYSKSLSLCILDIDHFKKMNDEHGHPAGDAILKSMGPLLKNSIRSVDFVGRYGGDEFVIIFPVTSLKNVIPLCERIRKIIEKHCSLTVSIGVTSFNPKKHSSGTHLLEAADQRLYRAKKLGGNQISF